MNAEVSENSFHLLRFVKQKAVTCHGIMTFIAFTSDLSIRDIENYFVECAPIKALVSILNIKYF